jgi:hypothetical protein
VKSQECIVLESGNPDLVELSRQRGWKKWSAEPRRCEVVFVSLETLLAGFAEEALPKAFWDFRYVWEIAVDGESVARGAINQSPKKLRNDVRPPELGFPQAQSASPVCVFVRNFHRIGV